MLTDSEIEFIRTRLTNKFSLSKIILFGSQARGTANKKSDVDLLVLLEAVMSSRRLLSLEMDRALKGLDHARDIIILTKEEFERDKTIPGTVARYAFLEGKTLYE